MPSSLNIKGSRMELQHDLAIPFRDGTDSRADVWRRPSPWRGPAILVRTPYLKEGAVPSLILEPRAAVERGFAVVVQDVRGRGTSGGQFIPFASEGSDGHDTIDWIAEQPWCDGRIVMTGQSYMGAVQWLAAAEERRHLRAIAPIFSSDHFAEGWFHTNGVLELGFMATWTAAALTPATERWYEDLENAVEAPERLIGAAPWLREWLANDADSSYWKSLSASRMRGQIQIPVLSVGGWYDIFLRGTLDAYRGHDHPWDRLVVGPWGHDSLLSHVVGQRNLGGAGAGEIYGLSDRILDFFEAVLRDSEPESSPVSAYILGSKRWAELPSWPPPHAQLQSHDLRPGVFEVDPSNVPPSRGGRSLYAFLPPYAYGPFDQTSMASRPDVIGSRLEFGSRVVLAGPVQTHLRVDSSGEGERMWVAILCVQEADGAIHNVTEGVAIAPTHAKEVVVPLGDVCIEVDEAQSLVVLICGGSFPRWPRPQQAGRQHVLKGSKLEVTVSSSPVESCNGECGLHLAHAAHR